MKKNLVISLMSICFLLGFSLITFSGPKLTPELKKKLVVESENIKKWVNQPLFINAVKAQNKQKLSLDEIKTRDKKWIAIKKSKGSQNALMKKLLSHEVSHWIKKKNVKNRGRYPEAFLCDNQGANVAVSKLTSDYWQGDETKWKAPFSSGKVFYGDPEYDESSKSMLVQVSVPVKSSGKTIGVLVVGVKFSALKK